MATHWHLQDFPNPPIDLCAHDDVRGDEGARVPPIRLRHKLDDWLCRIPSIDYSVLVEIYDSLGGHLSGPSCGDIERMKHHLAEAIEREELVGFQQETPRAGAMTNGPPVIVPGLASGPVKERALPQTTYEIVVVDEDEVPIAGVELVLGSQGAPVFVTDQNGVARLRGPAQPGAVARAREAAQLAAALSARELRPSRAAPLPAGEDWCHRSAVELLRDGAPLHEQRPTRLLLATRLEVVVHWPSAMAPPRLSLRDAPARWTMTSGSTLTVAVEALGLGQEAILVASPPESESPAPLPLPQLPPVPPNTILLAGQDWVDLTAQLTSGLEAAGAGSQPAPVWTQLPVDEHHEGVFNAGSSSFSAPPYEAPHVDESASWPPPIGETMLFYVFALKAALEGQPLEFSNEAPVTC